MSIQIRVVAPAIYKHWFERKGTTKYRKHIKKVAQRIKPLTITFHAVHIY